VNALLTQGIEPVPLDAGHTVVHMGYAFGYGDAGSLAMSL
jgi:hypothetical protein